MKRLLGAALLAIFSSACFFSLGSFKFSEDKRTAEGLIEKFHRQYNEGDFDGMYDLFTERGRGLATDQEFLEQIRAHKEKAGRIKNSSVVRSDVRVVGGSRLVHFFYETDYENLSIVEEFDCLVNGESVLIDFYGHHASLPPLSN